MKVKKFWQKNKYLIVSTAFVLALLLLWEIAVIVFKVDYWVLPKFSSVIKEFVLFFGESIFYKRLLGSLWRILLALFLVVFIGIGLGFCAVNRYIRACLRPIMATIKSVPVMAITLILLISFGSKNAPLIIGVLMGIPIMYNHTLLGLDGINKELVEIVKVYPVSATDKVFKVWFPLISPSLFSGIETSGGMCVKAVISAEILCQTLNSLGLAMYIAKNSLEAKDVAMLFAYCLVAILLSLAIEIVVKIISKPLLNWREVEE